MSRLAKNIDPELGARNLLVDCVGVRQGDRVLIVAEPPDEHHYDPKVPVCVARVARNLGAQVSVVSAPLPKTESGLPCSVTEKMHEHDHTVFLSRMADHARFVPVSCDGSKTICYALDEDLLGSAYATVPHGLMSALHRRLEGELDKSQEWSITCPLGTDVCGTFAWTGDGDEDFTFGLFPVTTFKPVPCTTMRGRVALAHWLIPGGKAHYEPAFLPIHQPVMADIDQGRLVRLDGSDEDVQRVEAHHEMVASRFGIDSRCVHSWHVGLNPHTFYAGDANADLERWGAVSFASPRYLHFHTCGDYAPGEIAWSVFDPTVLVDGVEFWKDGVFVWLEREDNAELIAQYPGAECLFAMRRDVGVNF